MKIYRKTRFAFTMIALMVIILLATLVAAGIGVAMIKGFNPMYGHEQSQIVTDAYVARTIFESVCRKATIRKADIDANNHAWVTVYYYANPTTSIEPDRPDRCAKFEIAKSQLIVSYGDGKGLNLGTPTILAHNVTAGKFAIRGHTVLMTLTLDNANDTSTRKKMAMPITSAALRQNE